MTLTLLFDLDDTLLNTNLDSFMPAYFQALSDHVCGHVSSDKFLRALIGGVSRMADNDDPRLTLQEVFDSYFYPKLEIPKEELSETLENFYDKVFPQLASHTSKMDGATELIDWASANNFHIAIATDPLFPRKATHERLRWAGFDPDQFELISTMEDFHFSKANPAYYAEVLGSLGWREGGVVMVGNDSARDIASAKRLGLRTFFIMGESASHPDGEADSGTLADFRPWLESTNPAALEPSFKSRDASLAILSSTPAALPKFLAKLSTEAWAHEPARNDWALNEIYCHLRDTEREVHAMQFELVLEKDDAFIPRPDTGVWASERDYLHEDASAAMMDFASARVDLLNKLKNLPEETWARTARHAIFGPTDFLEVVNFAADHDRLHLQQASQTVEALLGERVETDGGVL